MDSEETRIFEVYKRCASKNSQLLDIGVNKGQHSSKMLSIAQNGHVFGVEANPVHIKDLTAKYESNHRYTLIPRAVVPSNCDSEEIIFKVSDLYHGRGGIKGMHIWEKINPSIDFEEVAVKTVDFDFLLKLAGDNLDFIKIDIEGPEYSLIYSSRVLGSVAIRPSMAIENSVHGLDIAGITFDKFIAKLQSISYALISTNGELIGSEADRRKSGQTVFLCAEESIDLVCSTIVKFNDEVDF